MGLMKRGRKTDRQSAAEVTYDTPPPAAESRILGYDAGTWLSPYLVV